VSSSSVPPDVYHFNRLALSFTCHTGFTMIGHHTTSDDGAKYEGFLVGARGWLGTHSSANFSIRGRICVKETWKMGQDVFHCG
jgi:hypothetical protein